MYKNIEVKMNLRDLQMLEETHSINNDIYFDNTMEKRSPNSQKLTFTFSRKSRIIKIFRWIAFIIMLIVIVTLLILWLTCSKKLDSSSNVKLINNSALIQYSRHLVLTTENNDIVIFDPKNQKHSILYESESSIGPIAVFGNRTLFWIENKSTKIHSFEKNVSSVIFFETITPREIAVDVISEKLYMVDELAGTAVVIDLKNDHQGLILTDLKKPCDIVLDPVQGLMFIVQLYDSILRADMDGASAMEIVKNNKISAISINRKTGRIYWANDFESIEAANYDGTIHITLTAINEKMISWTIYDDRLFWLTSSDEQKIPVLHSCGLENEFCDDQYFQTLLFNATAVKAQENYYEKLFRNPCNEENGNCQHICLLKTNGKHSCACKIGWQLNSDLKTCQKIKSFILYNEGNYFRGKFHNELKVTFTDAILPVKFKAEFLKNNCNCIIDFTESWMEGEIFITDGRNIYNMNLETGKLKRIYDEIEEYEIRKLSIERFSNHLYFYKTSSNKQFIEVLKIMENKILRKTIINHNYSNEFQKSCSLITYQNLFWHYNGSQLNSNSIKWSDLDGSVLWNFSNLSQSSPGIMAIDYREKLIYYINEVTPTSMTVIYSTVEDKNHQNFTLDFLIENIGSMLVYKEWIFLCNSTDIWRFNKTNHKDLMKIITTNGKGDISRVHIVDTQMKVEEENNTCIISNGGCEQFCFFDNNVKKCDCENGWKINSDVRCIE